MSRRQKHVYLSEPDYDRLLKESKYHDKPEYREKCRALLLNHAGVSIKQIAAHLQVHPITVGHWLMGWEKEQVASLGRKKGQGCNAILVATDPTHLELLDKAVDRHRQDIKAIKAELVESLDTPMSTHTVKRFLERV